MSKPRILLADDHLLLLDGLRHLLERHYDLVGVVQDGHSVVSAAQRLQPDLVLMDVAMPILNGLQAGQRLRERQPNVKLLYVSMYGDTPYVEEALRIGASGYVLKRSGWEELGAPLKPSWGASNTSLRNCSPPYSAQKCSRLRHARRTCGRLRIASARF